jgi:hypothetical protein
MRRNESLDSMKTIDKSEAEKIDGVYYRMEARQTVSFVDTPNMLCFFITMTSITAMEQ